MKVFLKDGNAFVELVEGSGYLLCIGTEAEVENADEAKITELLRQALVWKRFYGIQTAHGETIQ